MSDGRDVIYIYDGSFEGLLTAIFKSYYDREIPLMIEDGKNIQNSMFCDYFIVETDAEKAERVSDAICKKISREAYRNLYYTYLSKVPEKGRMCLDYVKAGFKLGGKVNSYMYLDPVAAVLDAALKTKNEAHRFREFIRFSELEGGVYYSKIEPESNVLPLVTPHFAERFPGMPWIIHDAGKGLCSVYNGREWYITQTDSMPVLKLSGTETEYRKLWKKFYDSVEIKERHNEKCRMTHMPKKYWKNITEMDFNLS